MSIVVDERFEGPPAVANGGYVCGILAEMLPGPAEVRLHAPVPVGRALQLEHEDQTVTLHDDGTLLARGRAGQVSADSPGSVGFEEAARAVVSIGDLEHHPFPNCFVCGPHRAPGDGLRLMPAQVRGRNVMASPWVPHESLVDSSGKISERFVWAALDCPSYWPIAEPGELALLGTLAGRVFGSVRAGEKYVVVAWARERQGRKLLSGSAVYTESGEQLGIAHATWIKLS
jgi:hypothetical protein